MEVLRLRVCLPQLLFVSDFPLLSDLLIPGKPSDNITVSALLIPPLHFLKCLKLSILLSTEHPAWRGIWSLFLKNIFWTAPGVPHRGGGAGWVLMSSRISPPAVPGGAIPGDLCHTTSWSCDTSHSRIGFSVLARRMLICFPLRR